LGFTLSEHHDAAAAYGALAMERDVLKRSVALWVKDAMGR